MVLRVETHGFGARWISGGKHGCPWSIIDRLQIRIHRLECPCGAIATAPRRTWTACGCCCSHIIQISQLKDRKLSKQRGTNIEWGCDAKREKKQLRDATQQMNRQDGSRKANLPVAHVRHARLQAIISVEFRGVSFVQLQAEAAPSRQHRGYVEPLKARSEDAILDNRTRMGK